MLKQSLKRVGIAMSAVIATLTALAGCGTGTENPSAQNAYLNSQAQNENMTETTNDGDANHAARFKAVESRHFDIYNSYRAAFITAPDQAAVITSEYLQETAMPVDGSRGSASTSACTVRALLED